MKIKPCPFCGLDGDVMAWRGRKGGLELIEHPNTDCILADFKTDNLEEWNTRHLSTVLNKPRRGE